MSVFYGGRWTAYDWLCVVVASPLILVVLLAVGLGKLCLHALELVFDDR